MCMYVQVCIGVQVCKCVYMDQCVCVCKCRESWNQCPPVSCIPATCRRIVWHKLPASQSASPDNNRLLINEKEYEIIHKKHRPANDCNRIIRRFRSRDSDNPITIKRRRRYFFLRLKKICKFTKVKPPYYVQSSIKHAVHCCKVFDNPLTSEGA